MNRCYGSAEPLYSADMIAFDDDVKIKTCTSINMLMDNSFGVVSIYRVIEKLKGRIDEYILGYELKAYGLFSIFSVFLHNEFCFRRPYIFKNQELKDKGIPSIFKEALMNSDEIYRDQIDDFFKTVGISGMSETKIREEILRDYLRITKDCYMLKDIFPVSEEAANMLSVYMQSHMQKGFVSLVNFNDFSSLPSISMKWNRYLLLSACRLLPEIRIISFNTSGGKDNPNYSIVVPSSFKGTYVDVVVNFLRSTGKTEWHEDEFIDTLILNGLCRSGIVRHSFDECHDLIYSESRKIWMLKQPISDF